MSAPPIPCVWREGAFRPVARFHNLAAGHYGDGEVVTLAPVEERSKKSHDHYFVLVEEMWHSLPEGLGDRYPTSEHLRKTALIKTGYRDERSIVCASRAEALRLAAFVRPMDTYAVVIVSEAVVTVYTAKSQSRKAMGREVFQQSKDAVIGLLSDMIGVEPQRLSPPATNDRPAPRRAGREVVPA